MAVDIDKFMEEQKHIPRFNTKLTRWLIANNWILCENSKDLFELKIKKNSLKKLFGNICTNQTFYISPMDYKYKVFRVSLDIKEIELPPEATDEECIEIVKRLMERFKKL